MVDSPFNIFETILSQVRSSAKDGRSEGGDRQSQDRNRVLTPPAHSGYADVTLGEHMGWAGVGNLENKT